MTTKLANESLVRQRASVLLSAILLERGRTDEAWHALEECARVQPNPNTLPFLFLTEQRGMIYLAEGEVNRALESFFLARELADEWGIRNPAVTSWRAGASIALLGTGQRAAAHTLAVENFDMARTFGASWALGIALGVLAQVAEPDTRLERLTEAVDVLGQSGASLELARAMIDLGSVLRRNGQHVTARTTLRQGADLALICGAEALAERAGRELRASGARPRRLALSGSESLTPSERRVAELAAAGKKNSRIAETLFVSEKTVEGHLSRAYKKLGIQSRDQLRVLSPNLRPRVADEVMGSSV